MAEFITAVVLSLLGTAFIFAYIYSKIPEKNQNVRFFFLAMSMLMLVGTSLVILTAKQTQSTTFYDENNITMGYANHTIQLYSPLKESYSVVPFILISIFSLLVFVFIGAKAYYMMKQSNDAKAKEEGNL